MGAKKVYIQNHGLIKTDKSGKVSLTLNCPQPYKVDNITYPRHVHYTIEENGEWSDNIRTYIITCHINYEQLQDSIDTHSDGGKNNEYSTPTVRTDFRSTVNGYPLSKPYQKREMII